MSKASEKELDEVYKRGLEQGRKEAKFGLLQKDLPAFHPWTTGVRFQQTRSWFDGFVDFERGVTENLRDAEHACWTLERARAKLVDEIETTGGCVPGAQERAGLTAARRLYSLLPSRIVLRRLPALARDLYAELEHDERELVLAERAQRFIRDQLHEVRRVVDRELEFGRGYACTVEAIRSAATRPCGVHEFARVEAFVHGDRRRLHWGADGQMGAGGEDYGFRWRLENPLRRWLTTRWRVSWLSIADREGTTPTYEVYAIEFPGGDRNEETGRVWLMGKVENRDMIHAILPELEQHAQRERNSLVVVAQRLQYAARAEQRGGQTALAHHQGNQPPRVLQLARTFTRQPRVCGICYAPCGTRTRPAGLKVRSSTR